MFILAFCFAKLAAAYAYIFLGSDLDYSALFQGYCTNDIVIGRFDILNTIHFFLFRSGCSLGEIAYFWVFAIFQLALLLISFNKLYDYRFRYNKLLLIAIYFSPTILFFASAPTKDGFFVSITCIAIILINRFYNIFLFISGTIKPYLLALLAIRIRGVFSRFIMLMLGLLFVFYFGEQIFYLVFSKASYITSGIGGVSLSSFVWAMEIIIIGILTIFARVILKKDFAFVLLICVLGSGVSLNVASRIFTISIFYLLALRLYKNARS